MGLVDCAAGQPLSAGIRVRRGGDDSRPDRAACGQRGLRPSRSTPESRGLAGRPISDSTQAQAFRILLSAETKARTKAAVERLLARQNQDGGWGQLPGLASDAYATGQVLYAVNMAGVSRDRGELQRGIKFLVSNQRQDGSWPMTPRAQSGQKPASLTSPIVHFGSSWAVIGLARSVPE
jgi:hypothetical protein